MKKLLVICGPTAVGKTSLALKIAYSTNGELVSADSRQIYQGMDIGTGKDLSKSSKINPKLQLKTRNHLLIPYLVNGINIWLYDIVTPDQVFSAGRFYNLAWLVINNIWERGKLPILVGGSGLYIKTVIDGIPSLGIPENKALRRKLEIENLPYLQNKLKNLDKIRFEGMNNSDRNNPRRLIRAIEIANMKKNEKYKIRNNKNRYKKHFDALMVGLTASKDLLNKAIDKRVDKRVKQGIINEIISLLEKGYGWKLPSMSGLGYRQWYEYFTGKQSKEDVIQRWQNSEHDYARRQITWFKKDKRIIWYDITEPGIAEKIIVRNSSSGL